MAHTATRRLLVQHAQSPKRRKDCAWCFARFGGAGITFLVGAGVRYFQTIGTPVALTSLAFVAGLLLAPFGEETKGKTLPA